MIIRRRSGFTLLEMLVVIAIVGVITALLLPVFARARQKAQQTVCTSNLRQIGLAAFQYVQDNDGTLFDSLPHAEDTGGVTRWSYFLTPQHTVDTARGRLGKYITSPEIWNCPSAPNPKTLESNFSLNNIYPPYGLNQLFARQGILQGFPLRLSQIQVPAETLFAADCAPASLAGGEPYVYAPSDHSPWVQGRHLSRANVLWADGHVTIRSPSGLNAAGLGDILKGPHTGNAETDDYYYEAVKP